LEPHPTRRRSYGLRSGFRQRHCGRPGHPLSSHELATHVFERIRKYNVRVNAFVTLVEDQATVRARAADEALAQGKPWGPLHGVPILMKDDKQTAGIRSTCGAKIYANNIPKRNAPAVQNLLDAGAIIIGKTNLPEWADDFQSYNDVAGTTNNPWNPARTSGGSTGGGAAALACGMGFLELGSDIGGSIRTPSHFCGVFGQTSRLSTSSPTKASSTRRTPVPRRIVFRSTVPWRAARRICCWDCWLPAGLLECNASHTPGNCPRRVARGCGTTASAIF